MNDVQAMSNRYFLLHKPYNMLSQFVSPYPHHRLLGAIDFDFPPGTHAIGRLDEFSEGLLLLTTDKRVTKLLLHPQKNHLRHYLVQVQNVVTDEVLQKLQAGIEIPLKQKGAYTTLPCMVKRVETPQNLTDINKAYLSRIQHTWLEFVLSEGKNRQIRKMCKAVKHPVKRLIRTQIQHMHLGDLKSGEIKEIPAETFFTQLGIDPIAANSY